MEKGVVKGEEIVQKEDHYVFLRVYKTDLFPRSWQESSSC